MRQVNDIFMTFYLGVSLLSVTDVKTSGYGCESFKNVFANTVLRTLIKTIWRPGFMYSSKITA